MKKELRCSTETCSGRSEVARRKAASNLGQEGPEAGCLWLAHWSMWCGGKCHNNSAWCEEQWHFMQKLLAGSGTVREHCEETLSQSSLLGVWCDCTCSCPPHPLQTSHALAVVGSCVGGRFLASFLLIRVVEKQNNLGIFTAAAELCCFFFSSSFPSSWLLWLQPRQL